MADKRPSETGARRENCQGDKRAKTTKTEDQCVLCFRNRAELNEADSPLMPTHSCPQCNKTSWSICEECEETCLSRKCPVCRSPYAPVILHQFPSLEPNQSNPDRVMEVALARAKIGLITKIVGGSNTALYLPGDTKLRFFLPESFALNTQFSCIDIPISHDRLSSGEFVFNDKVWDELEDSQNVEEEEEEEMEVTYLTVSPEECFKEVKDRIDATFVDSEERVTYKIHSICKVEQHEHPDADKLMYKYYNIDRFIENPPDSPDEFEYTPCDEILSADWVTWTRDKEEWVMCCSCSKWRRLPKRDSAAYPQTIDLRWICGMNTWDTQYNTCASVEEDYSQTVAVTEEIDGVPVPVINGDTNGHSNGDININNSSNDNDSSSSNSNSNGTDLNIVSARQTNSASATAIESSGTMDLAEVLKGIFDSLKSYPGARLFTRLSPDTTSDILRIAREEGGMGRRS